MVLNANAFTPSHGSVPRAPRDTNLWMITWVANSPNITRELRHRLVESLFAVEFICSNPEVSLHIRDKMRRVTDIHFRTSWIPENVPPRNLLDFNPHNRVSNHARSPMRSSSVVAVWVFKFLADHRLLGRHPRLL